MWIVTFMEWVNYWENDHTFLQFTSICSFCHLVPIVKYVLQCSHEPSPLVGGRPGRHDLHENAISELKRGSCGGLLSGGRCKDCSYGLPIPNYQPGKALLYSLQWVSQVSWIKFCLTVLMGLAGMMYTCSFCPHLKSTLKPDFNVNLMSLCTSTWNGPTALENYITFWINILQMCCWEGGRCEGVQKVCKILSITLSWWMGMWHFCTYCFPNAITLCVAYSNAEQFYHLEFHGRPHTSFFGAKNHVVAGICYFLLCCR